VNRISADWGRWQVRLWPGRSPFLAVRREPDVHALKGGVTSEETDKKVKARDCISWTITDSVDSVKKQDKEQFFTGAGHCDNRDGPILPRVSSGLIEDFWPGNKAFSMPTIQPLLEIPGPLPAMLGTRTPICH